MTILIFNRTIVVNYINISKKKTFFEYIGDQTVKSRDQIYHKARGLLLDLITPDLVLSSHITQKMIPFPLYINMYIHLFSRDTIYMFCQNKYFVIITVLSFTKKLDYWESKFAHN